jgi:predicted nucleotidyltransferase
MTINSKLQNFSQQELVLSHNDTERNKILASLSQLEKVLKDKLQGNISEFLRFGSFTRNTILPRKFDPLSDIDLMVIFNSAYGIKTAATYRKYLLDVVSIAYPYSVSKKDFPVVKLELNHIMFDIVPAYTTEDWFNGKKYFIPDNYNGWRSTIPNDLNTDLANKNQTVGNNIIRNIVRLCKHWNAGANYPFESYLMEKEILNITFWGGDDTYSGFLKVMNSIAGNRAGVRQALDYIQQYKGTWSVNANEQKQFEWLQRLLPGLT